MLEKRQTNLRELFGRPRLQTLGFEFLHLNQRSSHQNLVRRIRRGSWRKGRRTSISKSLSIFTASPNMAMYCARLANCHMLRSVCNVLGVSTRASTSISLAARLRAGIVVERAVGDAFEGRGSVAGGDADSEFRVAGGFEGVCAQGWARERWAGRCAERESRGVVKRKARSPGIAAKFGVAPIGSSALASSLLHVTASGRSSFKVVLTGPIPDVSWWLLGRSCTIAITSNVAVVVVGPLASLLGMRKLAVIWSSVLQHRQTVLHILYLGSESLCIRASIRALQQRGS